MQVSREDRVEERDEDEGHPSRDGESPHLRVAERIPQRSAVHRERDEPEHGGADGDEHRAQSHEAGLVSVLERSPPLTRLLDEVEEPDRVAHDDADEACHPKKVHEPKDPITPGNPREELRVRSRARAGSMGSVS